jgi:SIT4-associating protein SAP185/190
LGDDEYPPCSLLYHTYFFLCGHVSYISPHRIYHFQEHNANISPLPHQQPKAPPPLQIPPSRARRQFALRLAQRKAQLDATRDTEDDADDGTQPGKTQEQEEREGHQRFARMFEGIEDSSDDDESLEEHGDDEDVIEVEGKEVGRLEGEEGGVKEGDEGEKKQGEGERIVV